MSVMLCVPRTGSHSSQSRKKYMSQLTESDCVVTTIAEVDIGSEHS